MTLATFTDPSNGYLVDDTCVFGAEILVIKNSGLGECLTPIEGTSYTQEWKISKFSTLAEVRLLPMGESAERNKSLSIHLALANSGILDLRQKVNASFTIRLRLKDGTVYAEQTAKNSLWFSHLSPSWGWPRYASLERVQDYLVDNECVVEAEVTILGTDRQLPRLLGSSS
ncbi:uncharacterized protein LOC104430963 [Eucalyptus grandis]|uniref:uncharacterized protein LOC104430963 n=1 Tax=Eucalyptus grandis TaxID=71139 RepID=UPI00192E837C|nr:uncharacterized protein LOC104430963 [Eucalyptus grandis]